MKLRILLACLGALAAATAHAQTYPNRPLALVVGFPPGGASDIIARQLAAKLSPHLGQQIVVENRVGAGGTVAAGAVARSAPDGYTMLFASASALAISPWLNKSLPYDTSKSFAPVIELVRGHFVLSASPSIGVGNVKEFAEYAARNPGKVSCGSAGPGTIHHLSCEMFGRVLGTPLTHVPYKGSAPAFVALAAGEIQLLFESVPTPIALVQSGRVRGIAVSGPRRLQSLPEVRTLAEQGIRDVEPRFWFGIVMAGGTPRPMVDRLNAELAQVLKDPELLEVFARQGVDAMGGSPDAFAALIRDELRYWGDVVAKTGVKID